jgi:aspartate dehydrogenase
MKGTDLPSTVPKPARIGLVGFGYIGRFVYEQVRTRPELGMEVAFVSTANPERLRDVPAELVLANLKGFGARAPDLVLEVAHPDVTRQHGRAFLRQCDYMPLSLTAFAEAQLERDLVETARENGTRLFLPHGAAVGLESIAENRHLWENVTVAMTKHPANLDFAVVPHRAPPGDVPRVILYDGPTRGLCPLFPRNVNSHASVALAGIGFDRTRSVLIADREATAATIEIVAHGQGVSLRIERVNPLKGVSGVLTLNSVLSALCRAKGATPVVQIV